MKHGQHLSLWYAKRADAIRGPYKPEQITRYILLGRIRLDDLLSQDRESWFAAASLTELIPPELTTSGSREDYRLLAVAQLQVDERKGERRSCQGCTNRTACHSERRTNIDRRQVDGRDFVSRAPAEYSGTHRFRTSPRSQLRTFLLSVLLATLLLVWFTPAVT